MRVLRREPIARVNGLAAQPYRNNTNAKSLRQTIARANCLSLPNRTCHHCDKNSNCGLTRTIARANRAGMVENTGTGYTGTGIRVSSIRIYGYTGIRVYGYTGIRVYGYTDIRVYGYTGIRVYGYTGIRIYGYTGIRIYRYK